MRLLKYRSNSVFHQTAWSYWDYLCFLDGYNIANSIDIFQRRNWQYSFIQDSYYALSDQNILSADHSFVKKWERVVSSPHFKKLQRVFEKETGKLVAVLRLSELMMQDHMDRQQEQEYKNIKDQIGNQDQGEDLDENNEGENGQDRNDGTSSEPQSNSNQGKGKDREENNEPNKENQSSSQGKGKDTKRDRQEQGKNQSQQLGPQNSQGMPNRNPLDSPSNVDQIQETSDQQEGIEALFPFIGKGSGKNERIQEALKLLNTDLNVRSLSNFLGFAKKAMRGAKRKGVEAAGEFTGYRNTTWSDNLHPMHRGGVINGDLRYIAKMAEGTLQERTYKEDKPRGRGPVIVLRDESGSMSGHEHMRALELEIALADVFRKEHREFVSIAWSDDPKDIRVCLYGKDDITHHITTFIGGGTRLGPAMKKGLTVAEDYVKGDILVLSDGQIDDDEDHSLVNMVQEYKSKGGRVWFVQIGSRGWGNKFLEKPWADASIQINTIGDEKKLQDIISEMNRKEHMKKKTVVS